jgi:Dolichyl-phosphate-mannose-protein mannosyltransferase
MSADVFITPPTSADCDLLPARSLSSRLSSAWAYCAESRAIAYAFFMVVYVIPNIALARHKLLWDDEFFTLYLSKTASWNDLWRALSTGADQHPPSFYYLTHLILKVAGPSHLTLRFTALFGFGLCCLCLYEIARQMMGPRWGVPAMLLPLTTPALYYATEARGYGLELGLITFSLLMWMFAAEGRNRVWTVPALAVGLCLAVASHYYAVLFICPLAIGELVKLTKRRSIDFPVCGALLASLIPLFLFAPLILGAATYSKNFWAVPYWGLMLKWYPNMLGRMPLVLLAASALIFVLRIRTTEDARAMAPEVTSPVVIAVTASALLPALGTIISKLVTHAFTERYVIAALPGSAILLLWGLKRMIRNNTAGPALVSILCIVLFIQQWRELRAVQIITLRQIRSVATLLRQSGDEPIVVSEIAVFHRLSFYARRDLAARLVYVADPHLSLRYLGHDTVDRGMLDLVPWFPLRVVWWHEWWAGHPASLVYGYVGGWTWTSFVLNEVGTVELMNRDVSRVLFNVTRTTVPEDDRLPADPSGKPLLYDEFPTTGPPLCQLYMPTDVCPAVDDPTFTAPIISYPDLQLGR